MYCCCFCSSPDDLCVETIDETIPFSFQDAVHRLLIHVVLARDIHFSTVAVRPVDRFEDWDDYFDCVIVPVDHDL